jgi:hypothetical protein
VFRLDLNSVNNEDGSPLVKMSSYLQDTKINSLPDEVKIDLNVFSVLMLNWVRGHVDNTGVVAKHHCGASERGVQLLEKLTEPGGLDHSIGHRAILGFSAGS